jgi:hypothetical protein
MVSTNKSGKVNSQEEKGGEAFSSPAFIAASRCFQR